MSDWHPLVPLDDDAREALLALDMWTRSMAALYTDAPPERVFLAVWLGARYLGVAE